MTCCVIWPSRTASQNSTKWDPWSSSRLRKSWQIWWEVCQKGWGFCLKIYIYYVVSCTNQTIIFHEYHLHFLHHHNYLHFTLFLPPHLPPATPTTTPSTVVSTSAALQLQYHCYHFRPFFWGGFPHFETHLGSVPGHDETHWPKCLELNHKCRCVKCPGHLWTQNGPIRVPTGTDEVSTRYQDDKYVLWCNMGILYLVEIVWVVVPNAANLPVGEPWNCLTNCGAGMCMSCSLKRVRTLQTENEWTNEPMKQIHFKDVLALFDWWQAFNVEICWIYCSNSMASVNVPPPHFVWWFACCSEFDRKKGAETWQAGGHVFHVFASNNQRIAGGFCSIAIVEMKQLIDSWSLFWLQLVNLWGSHGQVLRPVPPTPCALVA